MDKQHLNVYNQYKKRFALKAPRQHVKVTHNPSTIDQSQELEVRIPSLASDNVIVPGSLELLFNIELTSTATTRRIVDNLGKAIVTQLKVLYEGNEVQNIQNFDLYQLYKDSWLSAAERDLLISQGIDDVGNVNNLRVATSGAIASASTAEVAVASAYGKTFSIPLGKYFELTKHLHSLMLNDRLSFVLRFAPYDAVIIDPGTGSGQSAKAADGTYKITNISLEFDKVTDSITAEQVRSELLNLRLPFSRLHQYHVVQFKKEDTSLDININTASKSLAGVLLLFKDESMLKKYNRKVETFYNPLITKVDVTIGSQPAQLYSSGISSRDFYKDAYRFFGRFDTSVTQNKFYSNGYCLFLDMKTVADNALHGSGRELKSIGDAIGLKITKKADNTVNVTCYVFLIQDAQVNFQNGRFYNVEH